MEIHELMNSDGQSKKYRSLKIKPQVNDLIRIPYIPTEKELKSPNGVNTFKDLSIEKVYIVHRVINDNRIFIRDNYGQGALLAQSQYRVVEEVSDNEIELLRQNRDMLLVINNLIKNNKKV